MAVLAAYQLATPPDQPQAIAAPIIEQMPDDTLTHTSTITGPLQTGGGGPGDGVTIGYAG